MIDGRKTVAIINSRTTSNFISDSSVITSLLLTSPLRDRSCNKESLRVGAYRTPVRRDR